MRFIHCLKRPQNSPVKPPELLNKTQLQIIKELLSNAGYTENLLFYTEGAYVWIKGTNSDSKSGVIILANDNDYLFPELSGNDNEKVIASLTNLLKTDNIEEVISSLDDIDYFKYYMPEQTLSLVGEDIIVLEIEDDVNTTKFIDLGLPSGLLWADRNIEAESPEGHGLFFSWGNIEGSKGFSDTFYMNNYNKSAAASISADLTLEQDAANVYLGSNYHMPTVENFNELFEKCTYEWITVNGVEGRLFTSKSNGKSIFFPACGYYYDGNFVSNVVCYWSKSYRSASLAWNLLSSISLSGFGTYGARWRGSQIRAVADKNS